MQGFPNKYGDFVDINGIKLTKEISANSAFFRQKRRHKRNTEININFEYYSKPKCHMKNIGYYICNCSRWETDFSLKKLLKNFLRSTTTQNRLTYFLAIDFINMKEIISLQ